MASGFSRSSLFQTACNNAANIISAMVGAGLLTSKDEIASEFASTRDSIFEGLDAIAKEEAASAPPRRTSSGGGSASSQDPSTLVLNNGKHKGKTLGEVHAQEPGYIQWLAFKGNNAFLAGRARAYLAQVEQGAATAVAEAGEITGQN